MKSKRKAGRPDFVPTEEQRQMVEGMSGFGIPQDQMCLVIKTKSGKSITHPTLRKHFELELERGMTVANSRVAGALFKNAVDNMNVSAQIFWLKCRARWVAPEVHMDSEGIEEKPYDPIDAARRVVFALDLATRMKLPSP